MTYLEQSLQNILRRTKKLNIVNFEALDILSNMLFNNVK